MAKNYSSSNKNSYGEDGYNSTNKNKTNSSMGDKNASNKTSNKNAKILQTRMHLTHLTATVMMRATDTNQS